MNVANPSPPPGTQQWYWAAPRIAIALFVVAVLALLWLLHRQELEEQRATLISDVLWIEQDLRFHLTRNQELLQQLAQDYFSGELAAARFDLRARSVVSNSPEIVQIAAVDEAGSVLIASPGPTREAVAGMGMREEPVVQAFRLARSTGNATYSAPYQSDGNDSRFDVIVPVFREGSHVGSVAATYSMRALLARQVPWWFAEKYRLTVLDGSGNVLGSKSNVETGQAALEYQLPFDPPGHGLILHLTSYRATTNLVRNLLAVAIFGLAIGVLASLWALRRHVQRRLAAETALRREHAFRKAMEDSLPTGLRARDLQGRLTYVNPAFCRMVGYSPEELIGREPPMPYWDPDNIETNELQSARVLAGEAPPEGFESRLRHKNGATVYTRVYAAPLVDDRGVQTGWLSSVLDITEAKRLEEIQRQQQEKLQFTARLVTMGEMASTLAHELNQPLSAIASYTTGCLNRLEANDLPPEELRGALEKMATQAQRAGRIIRQVHEFVKKSEPRRAPCDVNAIVEDTIGFMEADARKRQVKIRQQLAPGLPQVLADRVMLEQVLLNLLRNGMEAMLEVRATDRLLAVSTAVHDGSIMVSVADRGCGIPTEVAAHLFEPFYSTKVEGMGMGLNICRTIIEFHKGRMWAEDNPPRGTVFRFTLPLDNP